MLDIEINTVKYKSSKESILNNIKLNIDKPGIYGIIGKNGVGKTTFFKCILNSLNFEGKILLEGKEIKKESILWLPTEPFLYNELTGKEFIDFYNLLTQNIQIKTEDYKFKIPHHDFIENYSTGMKKKTYLNSILTKDYDLYILDEPFNGLDIESNIALINILKEISKDKIILLSSHILDSLFSISTHIFLLQEKNIKIFKKDFFLEIEEYFK